MKPSKQEESIILDKAKTPLTPSRFTEIREAVYEMPDGKYRAMYLDLIAEIVRRST